MSGFRHEITGGGGNLVIPSVQSPNFVHGSSGWQIAKTGSVEFNNGTFRGTVTASTFQGTDFVINADGAFFYSGTPAAGNLIASIASANGTDAFGNAYRQGVTVYQPPNVFAQLNGGILYFAETSDAVPATVTGGTGQLDMLSGQRALGTTQAQVVLLDSGGTSGTAQVLVDAGGTATPLTNALLEVQGIIACNHIESIVSSAAETWHPLTFQNGWSNSGSGTSGQYRMLPTGHIEIIGDLTPPASPNGLAVAALPSPYTLASVQQIEVAVITSTGTAQVLTPRIFASAGAGLTLTAQNIPSGTTRVWIHALLPTGA